jgi:hypothetical protein
MSSMISARPHVGDPTQLAPVCLDLLHNLGYLGAPQLEAKSVQVLLEYMHKRAMDLAVPLDTSISINGFRLGYAEGLVCR